MRSAEKWIRVIVAGAAACTLLGATPVVELAAPQDVEAFFGTRAVKLVFVQSDNALYTVDYSAGVPSVPTPLAGTADAHFPVISPDGEWITFAEGVMGEFSPGPGSVHLVPFAGGAVIPVSDNGYVPRFKQDAPVPTIVYATCAKNTRNYHGYTWMGCGEMIEATYNGGGFTMNTICSTGSFLGGLSFDNRYFAHAEAALFGFVYDRQTPDFASGLHTVHCLDGAGLQVCNSSISSSPLFTDAVLYFDFGTSRAPASLGGSWRLHQKLFISRADGHIYKMYDVPLQQPDSSVRSFEWNYPEWSNHPWFAVAAVLTERVFTDDDGDRLGLRRRNELLYGINLRDSTYLLLARSLDTTFQGQTSMRWPWLWVERESFVEDPAWLQKPLYYSSNDCALDTASATPLPRNDESPSGCGAGATSALIPPFVFWLRRRWQSNT